MDFACPSCNAIPEPITHSNLAVVRHQLGCPTLIAQTRGRWPLVAAALPETPAQVPFEQRAAFGRWHKAVRVQEERRERQERRLVAG